MHGTNLQRVGRLASYLLTHPASLPRYVSQSMSKKATPLALELPWIASTAIDFLDGFLRPEHTVAEFGGGGSTLYFARRAKSVLCIESHEPWATRVQQRLHELSLTNVELVLHPYDPRDAEAYKASSNLAALGQSKFDIILVDGYEQDVPLRPACFQRAEQHVRQGGIIIVDDSWRYLELREHNRAVRWREFRSTGPCRPGVTSTDIFFY